MRSGANVLSYETPTAPALGGRVARWATIGLLVVGVQFWLMFGHGFWGRNYQVEAVVGLALLCLIPQVHRAINRGIDVLRFPSARTRFIIAVSISIAGGVYLYCTALRQHRQFVPLFHDEYSYIIQSQMLARGRLWMSAHPLGDFFDSTFLITDRVYASCYFPGTAMLLTIGVWLHWAYWCVPLGMCAVSLGLIYRVVCELVDGAAGWLAALMLLAVETFRTVSLQALSQTAALMLGLITVWAWLRWRRRVSWQWSAVVGVCIGWSAITRPSDAFCFAIPIAVAMALELNCERKRWISTLAACCLGAVPFPAIQLIQNYGITGRWTQLPYEYYVSRELPGTTFGFHALDPHATPVSKAPLKLAQYDAVKPDIARHTLSNLLHDLATDRLPQFFRATLPQLLLIILYPAGWILMRKRRWVLGISALLFLGIYSMFTFFLMHYSVVVAPAVIACVILGYSAVVDVWPKRRSYLNASLATTIAMLSITSLPEFNRFVRDEGFDTNTLALVRDAVANVDHKPAVVLFPFSMEHAYFLRVYNTDVAWPDDAGVIQANDLGPRNIEIFRYYASHRPQRAFYRFDFDRNVCVFLGMGGDLANPATTRQGAQ